MKNLKKIATLLLIAFIVVLSLPINTSASSIKLNKTKISLEVGKSTTLKVNGTKKAVKWSSSDKKIATVTKNGKVKGISEGKAIITAKVDSKSYKATITVKGEEVELIYYAYLTGNTTIEDYIKELEIENKDAKYKKYNDNYYIQYVKKSDYENGKDEMFKFINETLDGFKTDTNLSGVVKSVKYDSKYQTIKIYVDSAKYSASHNFQIAYQGGLLSDLGQTFLLIKPEDRVYNIRIIDYKTNKEIKLD